MSIRSIVLVALAVVVLAAPAAAEIYTISLTNGTEFQSRHRPEESSWDVDTIMVLTDVGNWIAIDKAAISGVQTDTEREGFGKVIDTHTIAIGWAPNDAAEVDPAAANDPMTRLLGFLESEQANQPNYNVDQFVEPGDAGMGGLPAWDQSPSGGNGGNRNCSKLTGG